MIYQRFPIGLKKDKKNKRKEFIAMLKYVDAVITFKEVPDEVALCISLSGCIHKCKGCHSEYLREDIGEEFNTKSLVNLLKKRRGITCVCIMGGDNTPDDIALISELLGYIKHERKLKTCWYIGANIFPVKLNLKNVDYLKIGEYKENLGPLSSKYTNQKFLKLTWSETGLNIENLNYKFRKNENEDQSQSAN